MKKELPHFRIESFYGGSQDWCRDLWMKMGGCGAVTFCDCCIFFDLYHGTKLYPFDRNDITKEDYVRFAMRMKPFLRPRLQGINKTEIFVKGAMRYLRKNECSTLQMTSFSGTNTLASAKEKVIDRINAGYPIPYLNLTHQDPDFKGYVWHWFLLNGYAEKGERLYVKAVTYGGRQWLDFDRLWNSGAKKKGGMVLFSTEE